ncbi:UDP-glucose 4-epimerase [Rhizomicrobium palustre]|uniref:UDP-glucose 4-epimerase n=1 Tax=Rhizomicrobium palustre TaxID=189966 RepID=A0A846MUP9_9PROT|nr:UDP-glucose 4-epimerase [Rhizomicrobium palustre]
MSENGVQIITGGAGFIGRCLTKRLLGRNLRVAGLDNFCRGNARNIAEFADNPNFSMRRVDAADGTALEGAMCEALAGDDPASATVWHLAANSDIPAGVSDAGIDLRDTFMTTFNVLQTMRKLGMKKLAFASTSAVYGALDTTLHEDLGPLFPISNYGAMKLASEAAISAGVESFLSQAWLYRFPNVIGGYATHGVIYDFARRLRDNPARLEVLGDGTQQKAYLLVDELVDAMLFIRDKATSPLNYYNIGPIDDGVTVKFIAEETVRVASPSAAIQYGKSKKGWVGDVPKFVYSTRKLNTLGWTPKVSSAEAIRTAIPLIWQESA